MACIHIYNLGRGYLGSKPVGNGRVIGGGVGVGGSGERAAGRESGAAARGLELLDHAGVLLGIGEHGDSVVVLGARADHGRAADVWGEILKSQFPP